MHAAVLTPFSSFHSMHAHSRRLCSQQPGHSQWLAGLDQYLLSVTGLSPCTQLQLGAHMALIKPLSPTHTAMHWWWDSAVTAVNVNSNGSLVLLCLKLAPALAAQPGPHHYTCVSSQPQITPSRLWLALLLQLCGYNTSSGLPHCLLWSLAVGHRGATEDPNSLGSFCGFPLECSTNTHSWCYWPQHPDPDLPPSWTSATTHHWTRHPEPLEQDHNILQHASTHRCIRAFASSFYCFFLYWGFVALWVLLYEEVNQLYVYIYCLLFELSSYSSHPISLGHHRSLNWRL